MKDNSRRGAGTQRMTENEVTLARELQGRGLKVNLQVPAAHKKQVQTYLRLTGCKLGYLLNFGEALMKDGITRCVEWS